MYQSPNKNVTPLTEKPTMDAVKAAIRTILSQDSGPARRTASDWLDTLKTSVYAWEICDQLLSENESIEVSYLAAHMLRHKISRNFNELPLECYSSLRDSLINHLIINEDYAVQGQLTMAIADLTLLLKAWANPIEDLAARLGLDQSLNSVAVNDYEALYKTLHHRLIFAYILHQICDLNHHNSERPSFIGTRRREEFEDYLISKCGQAITWWLNTMKEMEELKVIFNSQVPDSTKQLGTARIKCIKMIEKLTGQVYLCFSAWLRIFDEENLNDSLPVIDSAFKHLSDPSTPDIVHKYAVEVIVQTASYSDGRYDYMIGHLVNQIYALEPAFRKSVNDEDLEKSTNFVRIFSSVADIASLKYVIGEKDFRLIELLLSCLNHYDFEVIEETYNFWWVFFEHLQLCVKPEDHGPYINYLNRFIMSVIKLCQFDPDEDSVVPSDHDIHSFRGNTAEIITNVFFVHTVENFIRDNQILDNFRVPLSNITWEKLEAIIFLLTCSVQVMEEGDQNLKMQIFQSIMSQQANQPDFQILLQEKRVPHNIGTSQGDVHPQVVATTLQVIGWLQGFLAEQPECLALAISYILTSMSHPTYRNQLMEYASKGLSQIMESNATRHFSRCPELIDIIKGYCMNLDQFGEQAASNLLSSSAMLADAIPDYAIKDQFICEIINPNLEAVRGCLVQPKSDELDPTKYLNRLSAFFRQLSIPSERIPELKNFISLIDNVVWPLILNVLETHASEKGNSIERTCRTIRYIIRCVKPEWMIERVAETMINLYKTYPQNSSPLYICSILVDEFANRSPDINLGLFRMLEILCSLTFSLLNMDASQHKNLLTMKNYPETIDDMMRLFQRFVKKCPAEFLNCSALESIIELSISSLRLDHQEANESVTRFLITFLNTSKDYSHIGDAIKNVLGMRITDAVIKACLFDIPTRLIADEAQILEILRNFDNNLFKIWIEASVKTLPKVNLQGIESVTDNQLDEFKKEITNMSNLKGLVNCLRSFARQYSM